MVLVVFSWMPSHSDRETMARISLYHLMMSSWLSLEYLGKLVEEGPLIFRALICSARVSWAIVARVVASDCREDTVVVRAVMREEFWARIRFCCSKRAWMVGSKDVDVCVGVEIGRGEVMDVCVDGDAGRCCWVREAAVRGARMLTFDALFSAI